MSTSSTSSVGSELVLLTCTVNSGTLLVVGDDIVDTVGILVVVSILSLDIFWVENSIGLVEIKDSKLLVGGIVDNSFCEGGLTAFGLATKLGNCFVGDPTMMFLGFLGNLKRGEGVVNLILGNSGWGEFSITTTLCCLYEGLD